MKNNFGFKSTSGSKLKVLPLVLGAVSLTLVSAITLPLIAQTNSVPARQERRQNWLNLTAQQQQELQRIRQAKREQMNNILTAEQRAQLEAVKQNQQGRQNRREVFAALNLTEDQKARLQEVRQSFKAQMDAVLTAEQRQLLQQKRQQKRQQNSNNTQPQT